MSRQRLAEEYAAINVQRHVRGFLARKAVKNLLQETWTRKVDPDSGEFYFLNLKTGDTAWQPPQFISIDIYPKGVCDLCGVAVSSAFCPECDSDICSDCMQTSHLEGPMTAHIKFISQVNHAVDPVCSSCQSRTGIKECSVCNDHWCTQCFELSHGAGAEFESHVTAPTPLRPFSQSAMRPRRTSVYLR